MNRLTANLKPYLTKRRLFFTIILIILSWLGAWRVDLYSQKNASKESIEGKVDFTMSLISSVSSLVDSTLADSLKNLQHLEQDRSVQIRIAYDGEWRYDSKGGELTKFKKGSFKEDIEPVEDGPNLPFILKGDAWKINKIIPSNENPEFYLQITQKYSSGGLGVLQGRYAIPATLLFTFGLLIALISLYADRSIIGRIQGYVKELSSPVFIPKIPKELKNRPDLIDLVMEIKKLRIKLQHRETQEKAVNRMAHEMRKPVNAVHSLSIAILDDKSLSRQSRESFETIIEYADEGSALIESVLTLVKRQAQVELENTTTLNMNQIVERKVSEFKNIYGKVEFVCVLSEYLVKVKGDEAMVRLALDNVLRNAIEHGYIDNKAKKIEVETSVEGQKIIVRISDNGRGISHNQNPFLPRRNPSDGSGHGIGLDMVQEIMRLHRGEFKIANKHRWTHGAVATFSFPMANTPVEIFDDELSLEDAALENNVANNSVESLNIIAQNLCHQHEEDFEKYHINIDTFFDPKGTNTNVCKDASESKRLKAMIDTLFKSAIAKRQQSEGVLLNGQQSSLKIETHVRYSNVVFLFIDCGFQLTTTEALEKIEIQELHYAQRVMKEHYDDYLTHEGHASGGTVTKMTFKKL